MALPLQDLIETRLGIDEDVFAAALADFVDRVGPLALVDVAPEDYFGERQQAALRNSGANLRPLLPHELGPVAALAAAHAELVARSLSVAAVAGLLDVDPSRVRQRIYARSLYAFKHQGAWLVPAFQLRGRKLLPGLAAAVQNLPPSLHPVAVSRWLTTPDPDLEMAGKPVSPAAWLESGGSPEPVAALAGAFGQL